jgi:hypothetical protein
MDCLYPRMGPVRRRRWRAARRTWNQNRNANRMLMSDFGLSLRRVPPATVQMQYRVQCRVQ